MESPPPPLPAAGADVTSTFNTNSAVESHPKSNPAIIRKKTKKKRKDTQKPYIPLSSHPPQPPSNSSSSSCSTSNLPHSRSKGIHLSGNRRNPRVFGGPVLRKQNDSEADALALPLGMSIAAFVAQVLERKDVAGEKMSVDHLSQICTLAVKESLDNVFGNKFDCFVSNFERSFQSTLMTLRVIKESSQSSSIDQKRPTNNEQTSHFRPPSGDGSSTSDHAGNFDAKGSKQTAMIEEHEENTVHNELTLHENSRQLARFSSHGSYSGANHSMLTTFEKSVTEQARSNDLKAFEISLLMKKMKLKEAQFAVDCDSNFLERFKLSMGISKANFRAEKFKTELEDSRHAQLLKTCVDCLVAGLIIMLAALAYGTYVHSHQRLVEATESCMSIKGSSSWWFPNRITSFTSGLQILRCQVQVISRMLFGVLMIMAITYLLIQRSGSSNHTMPVTFILLLLGVGCGFAGKFCIDTLGGHGNRWLLYWELLCSVHFLSNLFTSTLFLVLHGPVGSGSVGSRVVPYWVRRFGFYATVLVGLPLLCGLMPFAGPTEWFQHFVSAVTNRGSTGSW